MDAPKGAKGSSAYRMVVEGSRQLELFGCVLERCSSGAKPEMLEARKEKLATLPSIHPIELMCRWCHKRSGKSGLLTKQAPSFRRYPIFAEPELLYGQHEADF